MSTSVLHIFYTTVGEKKPFFTLSHPFHEFFGDKNNIECSQPLQDTTVTLPPGYVWDFLLILSCTSFFEYIFPIMKNDDDALHLPRTAESFRISFISKDAGIRN